MSSLEQHSQWSTVLEIHLKLTQEGFRSLIAGGAVRDLLLGVTPNDIDIATNATPEQVEALFEKTVMVGRQFGVSRVILNGQDIEVATFRTDGEYKDGRKPEKVTYSSEKEDALRRDFTINGMFYDPIKKEVIDYVSGQKDLMQRMIRTVGDPNLRFKEDKLRVLRAIRFMSQLGFHIEQPTQEAMKLYSESLDQVSMERIRDEWLKLLKGQHVIGALAKAYDLKIWGKLFDNWNHKPEMYNHIWSQGGFDDDKLWVLWFLIHVRESREKLAELGFHWKLPKELIKKIIFCYDSLSLLKGLNKTEAVDVAIFLAQPHGRLAVEVYESIQPNGRR